jgi:group I intron endonuclease
MIYIGQTINFNKRIFQHKKDLRNGIHANRYLQNAWNFYGKDNFIFEVLEFCQIEELNKKECFFIEKYGTLYPLGYNFTIGGSNPIKPEGFRRKMSDIAKERFSNPKNHPFFGKKHTDESIEKNRMSNLNHPVTETMRIKQKENTPRGEASHFSKLKSSDVKEIKNMLITKKIGEIAKVYGVSYACIWEIKKGRTW